MTVKITKPAVNLREKLAEVDKPSGIAGEAMLRAETPQEQFNLIGAGRKNLIINGDCRISQRGDYSSLTNMADETYYIDRFEMNFSGVSGQKQHRANPSSLPADMTGDAGTFYFRAGSTATGFLGCRQTIEDYKVFDGRDFTVSAYVKTNHPSVRFYMYNGATILTGKKVVPNDGEWHRLEETFNFDASAGSKMSIEINALGEQAVSVELSVNDYIEFTGWQLELGKVATPFEHRSYGEELALCMRYYQTGKLQATGDGVVRWLRASSALPVTMRTTPTFTVFDNIGASGKVSGDSTNGITAAIGGDARWVTLGPSNVLIGTNVFMSGAYTADAEL